MRYLVLSDIHSNLEALRAVIAATEGAYDEIICCGDLIGYGPDPNAVVEWVRANVPIVVRGNHDRVCSGAAIPKDFSPPARASAIWTRKQLTPETLEYVKNMPRGPREVAGEFAILHGSPRDEDEYIPFASAAVGVFPYLKHRVSFFGHTHLQGGFVKHRRRISEIPAKLLGQRAAALSLPRGVIALEEDHVYYLNPGSVGQPRDRDNRAAFAIYDTSGKVEYGRVAYDFEPTMRKILLAGLPDFLAFRLPMGR